MSKSKTNKSRRDFVKKAALGAGGFTAAGSGLAFKNKTTSDFDLPSEVNQIYCDVAVVGGGVSGCYAALRLSNLTTSTPSKANSSIDQKQQARANSPIGKYMVSKRLSKLNVRLFEYSGRIGGRLLSTKIEGVSSAENSESGPLQYAEFGGFRFDRQMKIVWETAQALGLSDEPFYYQDIKVEKNNAVNVRGNLYTNAAKTTSDSYLSYPNITAKERQVLEEGYDLGNYITNLAFKDSLPSADKNISGPTKAYPNIQKIKIEPNGAASITFTDSFIPGQPSPTVQIPPAPNGWSFSFARFHYAFNAEKWKSVKAVADQYEQAKKKTTIGGRSFFDWSWWAIKRYYLSQEAVAYLEDTSGYNEEGSAGTFEGTIDENYYFSPKSDTNELTYYSVDPESKPTAWRHITEGYVAIPKGLYEHYHDSLKTNFPDQAKQLSEKVVKHQLIAFTKLDGVGVEYKYKCIFLKRQQGPKLAVSGSEALYKYEQSLLNLNITTTGLSSEKAAEVSQAKQDALETLKQYEVVYCNFLVLAMPRRSLELINQDNFFFSSPGVQKLLRNSVNNIPAMRMFVAYPYPWWLGKYPYDSPNPDFDESPFYPVGRTRTDLGLRQLYYWCYNKDSSANKKNKKNFVDLTAPAVMLASYTSGDATLYWREIQNGQPFDQLSGSLSSQAKLFNKAQGGPNPGQNISNPQAGGPRHGSLVMGIEAHKQIVELHHRSKDYDSIPLPYYVHYEDWTKDPWGGGWHSWASGFSKYKNIPLLRNPVQGENVFIIGECYSNIQGWVQGALNSAEAMLQCNFGLQWAPWLSINGIWLGQGTEWVEKSSRNPDPNPCLDEDDQFTGK